MPNPPIKNPTIENVKKYLHENEDVRVIVMDIDDTTLGHRVGANGKSEYYVLNEQALANSLKGHVLVFATDGLSDEKTKVLANFAKKHKLLFCPELMRSNAELNQARKAAEFLGRQGGAVYPITVPAPKAEFADSKEDFTLTMAVQDGYDETVTLDTPIKCILSSPNHLHEIEFVAPLNNLVQGKAFHFPLLYQKLGIMPKSAKPEHVRAHKGNEMVTRQVDYYDDKMAFVEQAAPFVDGTHHTCVAESIRDGSNINQRFAAQLRALDNVVHERKFAADDVFALWSAISDVKEGLPIEFLNDNAFLLTAFEKLDAAIFANLELNDQSSFRAFMSLFRDRQQLSPEEKKKLDDLGLKGQKLLKGQPFSKEGIESVFKDQQVIQRLHELKAAFTQFTKNGNDYAQKYADGYLESLAVNQPEKKSVFSNVKSKFSKKPKIQAEEKVAQNTNISLPGGAQIVIGNMVENLEGKMIVDPANAKTMDGNGGVSGAIKAYFKKKGKLEQYEADIHKVKPKDGFVCPNGEVRFTSTDGVDIVHTSVPDLREKENRVKGSKTKATDEAKQKMFEAYYHAFEYAHLHQVELVKPLECPLLGAGIFEWPAQVSAEMAGRALQAFRNAYGDRLQINICIRPEDLNQKFTSQNLKQAILDGIEMQMAEPMKPAPMQKLEFKDYMAMHYHIQSIDVDALLQHYNGYVATGRPKTEIDLQLIDMLKEGFSKITAMDKRLDPRNNPLSTFALISTIKEMCNRAHNKPGTPAFVKLCDDYLDKVANLIDPAILKKFAWDEKAIAARYQLLGLPELPNLNPSAPPLTESVANLNYEQARPSAPPFTQSEANLQSSLPRPPRPATPPIRDQANRRPSNLQYSQMLPRRDSLENSSAPTRSEPNYPDLAGLNFPIDQPSIEISPIQTILENLRKGLAASNVSDTSREFVESLIGDLESLDKSGENINKKAELARGMLNKAEVQAIMKAGALDAVNIIHAVKDEKPQPPERPGAFKRK